MTPQVYSPERIGHGRLKAILLVITFIFIIGFVIALLVRYGAALVLRRAAVNIAGAAVTAHVAIHALNENDRHLLESSLSPRFRVKADELTAEWQRVERDLGSVRSLGPFVGSVYTEKYQGAYRLISRGHCTLELERGSLRVHFELVHSKGKWLIDSMKIERPRSLNRPVVVQYPPPEIDVPYSLEQLQAQVRRSPDDFTAHFYLMCLYAQKGQWEQSLRHALQARRLNRSDVNVHLGIIYAYANLGRWQQAYESAQNALKLSFDNRSYSALLRVKGDLLLDRYTTTSQKNLLQQALSTYQQALKADPANIQASVGIARVEIERRSLQAAKRRLLKALSQVNENEPSGRRRKALVLYYLGVIEEYRGQLKEAKRLYQEAVQTHPPSFLPFTEAQQNSEARRRSP
ncbi:MAG: tetratricopeptide repeat protein [Armatimonadota bacterium]